MSVDYIKLLQTCEREAHRCVMKVCAQLSKELSQMERKYERQVCQYAVLEEKYTAALTVMSDLRKRCKAAEEKAERLQNDNNMQRMTLMQEQMQHELLKSACQNVAHLLKEKQLASASGLGEADSGKDGSREVTLSGQHVNYIEIK